MHADAHLTLGCKFWLLAAKAYLLARRFSTAAFTRSGLAWTQLVASTNGTCKHSRKEKCCTTACVFTNAGNRQRERACGSTLCSRSWSPTVAVLFMQLSRTTPGMKMIRRSSSKDSDDANAHSSHSGGGIPSQEAAHHRGCVPSAHSAKSSPPQPAGAAGCTFGWRSCYAGSLAHCRQSGMI